MYGEKEYVQVTPICWQNILVSNTNRMELRSSLVIV